MKTNRDGKLFEMSRQFSAYRNFAAVASIGIVLILIALLNLTLHISLLRLAEIGAVAEAAILVIAFAGSSWAKKNYRCQVDRNGLTILNGSNVSTYLWKDFTAVKVRGSGRNRPLEYTVGGRKLVLNSWLEQPGLLNSYIFEQIGDHVEIPRELRQTAERLAEQERAAIR